MNKLKLGFIIGIIFLVAACSQSSNPNELKVGVMGGSEERLMEVAKKVAADKYKLTIKIISFSDYNIPNAALMDGGIDANIFQHLPFLNQQIKDRGYSLVVVARTFIFPMGLYSKKITKLSQLEDDAMIGVPNDPTNEARALLLLQQAGLIKLRPTAGINATTNDVMDNPKHLKFAELDAAQLPQSLEDLDLVAINTTYAIPAGLSIESAVFSEGPNSAYANIIVAKQGHGRDAEFAHLVEAYQSPEVIAEAKRIFGADAIPSWLEPASSSNEGK